MHFVKDKPDIPEELLHNHEDGRVVLFCGAGISYPAKLPGFGKRVDDICAALHTAPTADEEEIRKAQRYDATVDLLEHRYPGGRFAVRQALAAALKPKLRAAGATTTHRALLALARHRKRTVRLVTTNFECVFESREAKQKWVLRTSCDGGAAPVRDATKSARPLATVDLRNALRFDLNGIGGMNGSGYK
jgi:NAD-dependent SIR2 family protein deacetylase